MLRSIRAFAIVLVAFGAAGTGCVAESHPSYNRPIDQTSTLSVCPTASDPAPAATIDTDIGAKLAPMTGEGVSVEYSSGGLWHIQSTCSAGYECGYEVTAEVFTGSVMNISGEALEPNDLVGQSCADTAYMLVFTDADTDGMTFTTTPGAKVRITAALDDLIVNNVIFWAQGGQVHHDANSNPIDLTPASP